MLYSNECHCITSKRLQLGTIAVEFLGIFRGLCSRYALYVQYMYWNTMAVGIYSHRHDIAATT